MSDDRIIFWLTLLTLVSFPFIVAALVFQATDRGEVSVTHPRVPSIEERMQRQRTKAYKAAVLLTVGASIASIVG